MCFNIIIRRVIGFDFTVWICLNSLVKTVTILHFAPCFSRKCFLFLGSCLGHFAIANFNAGLAGCHQWCFSARRCLVSWRWAASGRQHWRQQPCLEVGFWNVFSKAKNFGKTMAGWQAMRAARLWKKQRTMRRCILASRSPIQPMRPGGGATETPPKTSKNVLLQLDFVVASLKPTGCIRVPGGCNHLSFKVFCWSSLAESHMKVTIFSYLFTFHLHSEFFDSNSVRPWGLHSMLQQSDTAVATRMFQSLWWFLQFLLVSRLRSSDVSIFFAFCFFCFFKDTCLRLWSGAVMRVPWAVCWWACATAENASPSWLLWCLRSFITESMTLSWLERKP